jgi:hypothetical protein
MTPEFIEMFFLSETTFSQGRGSAGIVDIEVEHDELGIPFVGGKTIRGLLRDTWLSMQDIFPEFQEAGGRVFGISQDMEEKAILRFGDAMVDQNTLQWIKVALTRERSPFSKNEILESLTEIRWQTAENRETGAPEETTLRSVRVVIPGIKLKASLFWFEEPTSEDLSVLSLTLLATRHGGLSRHRGKGHICLTLNGNLELTRKLAKGEKI